MACTVTTRSIGQGIVIDGRIVLTLEETDGGRAHLAVCDARRKRELDCPAHERVAVNDLVTIESLDLDSGQVTFAVTAPGFVSVWQREEYPEPEQLPR
jgi:sRNA-binding carbon storage regulator CsrA